MKDSIKAIIRAQPYFEGMKPDHLDIVVDSAIEMTFEPEEILFHEGEPANRLYLIEAGGVVLEAHEPADGTVVIQTLGPGELLGWSWLFPPFVWHFRARAVAPTRAILLDGAHLLIAAERDHDFGYRLMKRVAQVLIHRLEATRQQLLKRPDRALAA